MPDSAEADASFNTTLRECVINVILIIFLHVFAYIVVVAYSKRIDPNESDYEDEVTNRVAFFICVFSLSISMWAALLLPISVISNEVLHVYPDSIYINWLNSSLIQGFWKWVFLFSNASIFVLLPFAFFFTESQGFSKSQKGIKARLYETVSLLALTGAFIVGFMYILRAIFDCRELSLSHWLSVWDYFLPFLYSCVSFLGVLMLLSCTPVGFAQLFTVASELVMKSYNLPKDDLDLTKLRGLSDAVQSNSRTEFYDNYKSMRQYSYARITWSEIFNLKSFCYLPWRRKETYFIPQNGYSTIFSDGIVVNEGLCFRNGDEDIGHVGIIRTSWLYLGYPVTMLSLLSLTIVSVLMVAQNILALSFGIKTLPIYSEKLSLGISSLSALGPFGALIEIIIILYLWCSSVVGLYELPFFCHLKPKYRDTPMVHIIGNCAVLLVLSSALPVLARTLGITNFDLLGDFGKIYWLGNFYIVLFYNIVFAVATALCFGSKMTASMRAELKRLLFMEDAAGTNSESIDDFYKKIS